MAEEEKIVSGNEASQPDEETDVEGLKGALAEEKEKAERYLAGWQRAEADFDNYRKRTEEEKSDVGNSARANLILDLLPVLDDLKRALASSPPKSMKRTWVEGIRLIYRKLEGVLQAQGLTEIDAIGEPFDPSLHEAVAHQEGEEGLVIDEIQRGYRLKGKVLRPTLAVVGKGKEKKAEESEEAASI